MKVWLYTALLLILSLPAAHADYDSATAAYNSGDRTASFLEFKRLAAGGHVKAQFMLGTQYLNGEGVLQDFVQAHKWFNLAASAGHPLAAEYRDRVAARMTRAQVAQAQQLARQWKPDKGRQSAAAEAPVETVAQAPSSPAVAAAPATRAGNTVARIQRLLNANGYDAGPADGKSGRKTREAIRRYQADSGLFQDGEPSPSLLTFMEAQFPQDSATGTSTTTPPVTASTTDAAPAPAPPVAPGAKTDTRLAQLLAEMQQLTREGERTRAANSRFLGQLRDLTSRYSRTWAWPRLLLDEPFSDADYVRNPAWQISSGDFYLTRGAGLQSRVSAPAATTKKRKNKGRDLAINLLGSILNSQQGTNGNRTFASPAPEQAAIHIPQRISNSFALRLVLNARSATQGAYFSFYQGRSRQAGYRLDYTPGHPGQLQLLRTSSRGNRLIASDNRSANLADGADHNLLWSRDGNGVMRVSIDGDERLRGTDSGYRGAFDGFGFGNLGGDYTLRELRLYGSR